MQCFTRNLTHQLVSPTPLYDALEGGQCHHVESREEDDTGRLRSDTTQRLLYHAVCLVSTHAASFIHSGALITPAT